MPPFSEYIGTGKKFKIGDHVVTLNPEHPELVDGSVVVVHEGSRLPYLVEFTDCFGGGRRLWVSENSIDFYDATPRGEITLSYDELMG